MENDDRIWRISSLTGYIDSDTRMLLLPLPESKRTVKIKDTAYKLNTVGDLVNVKESIAELKRFEDMSKDEISEV